MLAAFSWMHYYSLPCDPLLQFLERCMHVGEVCWNTCCRNSLVSLLFLELFMKQCFVLPGHPLQQVINFQLLELFDNMTILCAAVCLCLTFVDQFAMNDLPAWIWFYLETWSQHNTDQWQSLASKKAKKRMNFSLHFFWNYTKLHIEWVLEDASLKSMARAPAFEQTFSHQRHGKILGTTGTSTVSTASMTPNILFFLNLLK